MQKLSVLRMTHGVMKVLFAGRFMSLLLLCAVVSMGVIPAGAAQAARLSQEISGQATTPLKGSLNPLARSAWEAGRVPAGTQLKGITLRFSRTTQQQAELDTLVAAQQNRSSALYHQWLTPEQYAARFGMAESDIAKTRAWLEQQGFTVESVSRSRTEIRFSGRVSQVESAFATQMHYYTVDGEKHFAPSTALSLPAGLASVVVSVRNLNDFRPKPHVKLHKGVSAKPGFTFSQSGNVFFTPGDIKLAYGIDKMISAGYTGTGQSIAIVGQSSVDTSDITNFQSAAGLTSKTPTLVLVPGTGTSVASSGDELESDLDLEWSGGIATGATIYFVYTGSNTNYGVFDSMSYAVDEDLAPIISVSYGACEGELGQSDVDTLEAITQQGATQGQTFVASSGDSGSTSCYVFTSLDSTTRKSLSANYPASSAYVTGIGGTEIDKSNSAYMTAGDGYWEAKGSSDEINSLLKYAPEVAWNDDSSSDGISSTGGGVSTFIARPSWQTGVTGISSGSYRMVPDVSFYSSPSYPGYLYCSSDTETNVTGSCANGFRDSSSTNLTVAGGTSFAAPIFAGMVAILNQAKGYTSGQGVIASELYALAATSSNYSAVFHDITSGDNKCTAGSTYCSSAGESAYTTTTGYDEVTGLGSLDLYELYSIYPTSTSTLIGTTTTVAASDTAPTTGTTDKFTITVASTTGSTVPSGEVEIQVDGTSVGTETLGTAGTYAYSTSFSTTGTHTVTAKYAGDTTHASSTGTVSVTASSSGSTLIGTTTTVTASNTTPTTGATVKFTIAVASTTGSTVPSGDVQIQVDGTGVGTEALGSDGTYAYSTSFSTTGTHTVTAKYAGDTTHASSTGTVSVTASAAISGTFTLTATSVSISQGSSGPTTITVTPANGYTGTVDIVPTSSTASFCYSTTTATVSGSSAVSASMTIYTDLSNCSSGSSVTGKGNLKRYDGVKRAGLAPAPGSSLALAGFGLAGVFLAGLAGWRWRRARLWCALMAIGLVGLSLSSCGGSSSSSSTNYTGKGAYTVTLTGTDSASTSIKDTATFTLTVK